MHTRSEPGIHVSPSAEIQIGIAVLEALAPMFPNLAFARKSGLTVTIPEEIEAAYVAKHGKTGQWYIDVILGRKETIASVSVKVFMKLEDQEPVGIHSTEAESPLPDPKSFVCTPC